MSSHIVIDDNEFSLKVLYRGFSDGRPQEIDAILLRAKDDEGRWWRIYRGSATGYTPHPDLHIPQRVESALALWLNMDGKYGGISLIEFLTSTGVLG